MNSLSDQMMQDGLQPWYNLHGQTVTITSGLDQGKSFIATLVVAEDVVFKGEILSDNREKTTVVFPNNSFPALSKPGDFFKDASGQKWKLGKRVNNPIDSTVDFEAIKQV